MPHKLFLGDLSYSSWSLRAGLLQDRFALPLETQLVDFLNRDVADQMAVHVPARTVPTLLLEDGAVIWDSLAIAEELATLFPDAGLWPAQGAARAMGRSLAAEMHSGFAALRDHCPMNLRVAYVDCAAPEAVLADVARIDDLWQLALDRFGGPWLVGDYSIADAFFAPVAARLAGYGLTVSAPSQAYVERHLADPAFRRWRARGFSAPTLPWYRRDYPQAPWPGPTPLPARAVEAGPAVNDLCPYSGKPPQDYAEIAGKIYGFCNPGCRDKTVADAEAWPKFMEIYQP